jgi:hypothetical protein
MEKESYFKRRMIARNNRCPECGKLIVPEAQYCLLHRPDELKGGPGNRNNKKHFQPKQLHGTRYEFSIPGKMLESVGASKETIASISREYLIR